VTLANDISTSIPSHTPKTWRFWRLGIDSPLSHRRALSWDIPLSRLLCLLNWLAMNAAEGRRLYLVLNLSLNSRENVSAFSKPFPFIIDTPLSIDFSSGL
jgi:hypothetical protein